MSLGFGTADGSAMMAGSKPRLFAHPLKLGERDWPEPDFYLFPALMQPEDVRGPDALLLIEVSDSTLRHDLRLKAELYRKFGVNTRVQLLAAALRERYVI